MKPGGSGSGEGGGGGEGEDEVGWLRELRARARDTLRLVGPIQLVDEGSLAEAAATVRSEVDVADAGDQQRELHRCGRRQCLLLRVNP